MGIERWHDSIFLRPPPALRCKPDLSGEEGERASKQACQVANGRQTNAPLTYIHSTKREREEWKGPSYSTAQVPRDWWAGGRGEEKRGVLARGRGLASAVVKCNAAGGGRDGDAAGA